MPDSESQKSKESGFWAFVGKLSTIFALALSAIALWSWTNSPDTKLSAVVETGSYVVEPEVRGIAEEISRLASQDNFSKLIGESVFFEDPKPGETAIEWLSKDFQQQLREALPEFDTRYTGFWKTVVRNEGDVSLKDVSLRLPEVSISEVRFEDGTVRLDETGPTIEIGALAPGQSVTVNSWSESSFVSQLDFENVNVYHADGRGEVTFPNEKSEFSSFVASPFVLLLALPVIFVLAVFYQVGVEAGKKSQSQTAGSSSH